MEATLVVFWPQAHGYDLPVAPWRRRGEREGGGPNDADVRFAMLVSSGTSPWQMLWLYLRGCKALMKLSAALAAPPDRIPMRINEILGALRWTR